jgi:Flp pilus assembly CpaF family ATPase
MLSGSIQKDQRIITIEDNAELQLKDHPHVLRMQARAANSEGVGQVTIRQMLANALRQRPDRIIVGECRGGEALDMLEAMSTGHDGSLTTVHANDARECVSRMQVLISYAGMNLPADLIAQMFSLAVDFVVATKRYPDGSRHVSEIVEIRDMDTTTGQVTMQPIIEFRQYGRDEKGKIKGIFASTGQGFSRYHRDKFEGNGVSVKNAWFKNTPQEGQILSNLRR